VGHREKRPTDRHLCHGWPSRANPAARKRPSPHRGRGLLSGHLLEQPGEAAAAARDHALHDQLLHRVRPTVAIDPQALVELDRTLTATDEVPVAAVGQGKPRAATAFGNCRLDTGAEVEAYRVGHLAARALAPGRDQLVLPAQLGTVVAQQQDAAMDETEARDIAVMACLQPGRAAAALGGERAPVDLDFADTG